MQKIKMVIVGVMMTLGLAGLTSGAAMAYQCPEGTPRAGEDVTVASQCSVPGEDGNSEADFNTLLKNIINFLIGITAVIAIFVVVIAGIQMATSQGDASRVTKSRNMILYGVVGLVIAILAFAIVNFVLTEVFHAGA